LGTVVGISYADGGTRRALGKFMERKSTAYIKMSESGGAAKLPRQRQSKQSSAQQ